MRLTVHSGSERETEAAGRALAVSLDRGSVVLLHGDLGAGKTAFVRGLAAGFGADPEDVSSPTFTLVQEYAGWLPVYHVDLYRLAPSEVRDLGLEELSMSGVLAVEWAEKWDRPAGRVVEVRITDDGETRRTLTIDDGDYSER
jgi:tRNA threonylcarbamoyladenosine biosynthesis protein TsaE